MISCPQSTVNSITEAPGKVVVHVRIPNSLTFKQRLIDLVHPFGPKVTSKLKTVIGVETIRESIYIAQTVTDEDGSLKIKQIEEFTDSKAHLDFVQAVTAAKQSHPPGAS